MNAKRRFRKLTPHQRKEALARRERGEESQTEIARSYNVSHSTRSVKILERTENEEPV